MTRLVRTMCPMNCHPTLCGMLVEVEDGRLVDVTGDKANPDSNGFLCVRGHAAREIIDNPERLLHPLMRDRRTDAFRRAGWDEVLDRIAAVVADVGRERLALWSGHGTSSTNYGVGIGSQYLRRFADLAGCQMWNGAMICWGMGGFGLGVTGPLETHTKQDMSSHAEQIWLWGANLASQPNTTPHLIAARRRGARVVTIDVRQTEATRHSDEVVIVRPGTDTALALALMHVLITEDLCDTDFVAARTIGFDKLAQHVQDCTPQWAAQITGVPAARIQALARSYATTRPSMILLGGSSLHKGGNSWLASRAIACLPALAGHLGIPGGGFGPRHGASSHGQALNSIALPDRQPPGDYVPNQMAAILEALEDGRVQALFLPGANMLSSFADSRRLSVGLDKTRLVVGHDLFLSDTARQFADIVLPGTSWLEQLGCKSTNTHLYLMEQALEPPGQTRPLSWILRRLADRLGLDGFFPWSDEAGAIDAIIDHPSTGNATVASLRASGGIRELKVSHVAHPDHRYSTPSGKVEFYSQQLADLELPPLPVHGGAQAPDGFPLVLTQGRTLHHFHSFYNSGQVLPSLRKLENGPTLWLSPADAAARGIAEDGGIRVYNGRGELTARARVTDEMPDGTVWMRDGWTGLNRLTGGEAVLPDEATDLFAFTVGQSSFEAFVEVEPQAVPASEADILTAEDHAFWREHGYLVVPDVVPLELCESAQREIMEYLGLDPAAPIEDHYDRLLPDDREGFVNMLQAQSLWDTRQWPKVHRVFAELLGTQKLWVSVDQAHMKLPYRQETGPDGTLLTWGDGGIYYGPGDPRNHHGGLHWDVGGGGLQDEQVRARKAQGKTTGGLWAGTALPDMLHFGDGHPCIPQGVLYLNDRDENGGGFRCVPGFHHRYNDWLATLPEDKSLESRDGGQWIVNHPELEGLFAEARNIPAKAGSLVIWHRLLPHINGRNLSSTPRFAQYIAMEPPPTDPEEFEKARAQRIAAWEKTTARQRPASGSERQARQQKWERDNPPAELTDLGKKLLGLEPWDV